MAHENLKFALSLERKEWQPIMGAQDYGTFYMVYIKFNSYEKTTIQGGDGKDMISHHYKVDFKIQNFVGAVTMGLGGSPSLSFEDVKMDFRGNVIKERWAKLNLSVAPFSTNNIISNYKLIGTEKLEKGKTFAVVYNRLAPPVEIFNPGNLNHSVFLNPHTITRDGDDYLDVATRKNGTNDDYEPEIAGEPFGICNPSHSIII